MSGACERPYKYYRVEVFAANPGTWMVVHKYSGNDALALAKECAEQFPDDVSTRIYKVKEKRVK